MIDTSTGMPRGDEELRAAAEEIHRTAPAPHPWGSIDAADFTLTARPSRGSRRGVLELAAAAILVAGIAGTAMVANRDPGDPPAPSVEPSTAPTRTPVIEQPSLTGDLDVIEVTSDGADWVDRALFPLDTPDGFTLQSVSRGAGGDMTEYGGTDTGDVAVTLIPVDPSGEASDRGILIETVPSGIGGVESDVDAVTMSTGSGVSWDVYVESGPDGTYQSTAFARTEGPGATVSLAGMDSPIEALRETESLLGSLRLVRVDDIPTEVVDMSRLPVVVALPSADVVVSATRTTNAWCVVSEVGNSRFSGCGFHFDPTRSSASFIDRSWNGERVVTLVGMAAPAVTSIEVDLADGTTVTIQPTFAAGNDDGIGFWAATHRHDGRIGTDGPVVATRVLDRDGNVIGTVDDP
jgi:hypothetical protein